MKHLLLAAVVLGFTHFAYAQDDPKPDKQTEEIIIRNKGNDKDLNMTIQINGDSIMVNGKPLDQFINDNITIKKRKMIIHDGDHSMSFDFNNSDFAQQMEDVARQQEEIAKREEEIAMQKERMGKQWKESSKPFLGVTTEKADKGVKVTEVVEASAAAKAGLKEGDIITKVGDKKIDNPEMLSSIIMSQKPKDEVKVYYIRDGKEKNVKAVLGERTISKIRTYSFHGPKMHAFEMPEIPDVPEVPGVDDNPGFIAPENFDMMPHPKKLGIKIQDTEEGKVKVIDVEDSSAAAKAGLLKDDIITEIDGDKINNTDDAREHLHPEPGKNSYKIKVNRNGTEMSFDVKIPKKLKTADL